MNIKKNRQDWEEIADLDPLWSIAALPEKKFNKWKLDEFFRTGEEIVNKLFNQIKNLDYPSDFKMVLDFGCGAGRLSRSLAKNFDFCYGVDISEKMIDLAKNYNQDIQNCKFFVNHDTKLSMFPDNKFDLIFSHIVLQHISDSKLIKSYILDFVRILKKNGLLVFQLPSNLPFITRTNPKKKLYRFLRTIGFKKEFLYKHLKIHPISMNFIPEHEVQFLLTSLGCKILKIDSEIRGRKIKFPSKTYYVSK